MAIYIFCNHQGLDGLQVARSLEIVGVRTYVSHLFIGKL